MAPNRPPSGWPGQYGALSADWGMAPIYVGQQDPRTGRGGHVPSSVLTAEQGAADGADAANLASADGFPAKSYVFLDWEQGDITAEGSGDYIQAWIKAVYDDGRMMPGVYCSHSLGGQIVALVDALNPTPNVRFWCWKVPSTQEHDYDGDLQAIPERDPKGCGFAGAQVWQREQNADVGLPAESTLNVDFGTAALSVPGAP